MGAQKRSKVVEQALIWIVLLMGSILFLIPLFWMISTSFKERSLILQVPPVWIPDPFVIKNYMYAWSGKPFISAVGVYVPSLPLVRYFLNSFLVASSTMVFNLFFDSLAGYAFAKYEFPGRRVFFVFILSTMVVPFYVIMIPVFLVVRSLGWYDTYYALIIPGIAGPFGIFLMKQFIHTIPSELLDAGRIDGCSEFRLYWNIVLPLAKPALAALGIFVFIGNWNSFIWPLIVTESKLMRTIPLGLAMLNAAHGADYGLIMAVSTCALVPLLIVFVLFSKGIVKGIVLTGIKG